MPSSVALKPPRWRRALQRHRTVPALCRRWSPWPFPNARIRSPSAREGCRSTRSHSIWWLSRNPSFSCPRAETIDAGTLYVTTAQPGATQVASLDEMSGPCCTTLGLGTPPSDLRLGTPSRSSEEGANPQRIHLRLARAPSPGPSASAQHHDRVPLCWLSSARKERLRLDRQLQRRCDSALTRGEDLRGREVILVSFGRHRHRARLRLP